MLCGPLAERKGEKNVRGERTIDTGHKEHWQRKGLTALNYFWATMNVSHRGLNHKTYQEHLKRKFSPAAASAVENVFADAVSPVKAVYRVMKVTILHRPGTRLHSSF